MSLASSTINTSETSIQSDCPDFENSSYLNNNAQLHGSDLSLSTTLDENIITNTSMKLSISLDTVEREQLKTSKGRQLRSDSLMNLTHFNRKESTMTDNDPKNVSLDNNESIKPNISKTLNDVSEDSVIPIEEEDEDEETLECSTLRDSSVPANLPEVEKNMFSHLQPISSDVQNKSSMHKISVEGKTLTPHKAESSIQLENNVENESTVVQPNETEYFQNSFVELGRRLWPSTSKSQCYTKGCFWSPDGTCLLVPVHMDGMHVMELPTDLYTTQELDTARELSPLKSVVHVKEGGMVYDVSWYPFMNSTDPATCCWLASRKHEPIHMWDAFTGDLRCSYRGYDDVDEVEAAISVAFNNDGQKIVGGYKKSIKIFDTNVPGRVYTSIRVKQTVSCLAFTTENDNCVTTGSWNSHIYHYDLRAPKLGPLFTLGGHKGGVTWLKYSSYHNDNWTLFSGARMDGKILQWDMRNYQEPVKAYERKVETNQRIYFDLSTMQKWLISGDTGGSLRIWDMDGTEEISEVPLHADCCNGVSFHPYLPILSTSSGQFHFVDKECEESSKENEKVVNYENCVMLLWFGDLKSLTC